MNRAEEMWEMYSNRMTLQEVGDHFGLTRERIRQILKINGHKTRSGTGKIRHPEVIKFLLYDEKMPEARVAKKLGICAGAVETAKKVFGLVKIPKHIQLRRREPAAKTNLKLMRSKMTIEKMADKFGISNQSMIRCLTEQGIKKPPTSPRNKKFSFKNIDLKKMFIDEGLTGSQIADKLSTSRAGVYQALYIQGIRRYAK